MNKIKSAVLVHLCIFATAAILSVNEGQQLQTSWVIHPVIAFYLFFLRSSKDKASEYARFSYLLIVPTIMLYKFSGAVIKHGTDIEFIYWFLDLTAPAALYLAAYFMYFETIKVLPVREVLKDLKVEEKGYAYPPIVLRIAVIILYIIIFSVANGLLFGSLLTDNCILNNICSGYEQALHTAGKILWLVVTVMLFVSGWRGKLWGCRRKLKDVANIV